MDALRLILVIIMTITFTEGRSIGSRKTIAEARELKLGQTRSQLENDVDIGLFKAAFRSAKRDCTSPMCWFRPGRREAQLERKSIASTDGVKKDGEICRSPMCWFRGKKRRVNVEEMAKKLLIKKTALKNFLRNVKERAINIRRQRQLSEDGCESPMCWFRPGRSVETNGHKPARKEDAWENYMQGERKRVNDEETRATEKRNSAKRESILTQMK